MTALHHASRALCLMCTINARIWLERHNARSLCAVFVQTPCYPTCCLHGAHSLQASAKGCERASLIRARLHVWRSIQYFSTSRRAAMSSGVRSGMHMWRRASAHLRRRQDSGTKQQNETNLVGGWGSETTLDEKTRFGSYADTQ